MKKKIGNKWNKWKLQKSLDLEQEWESESELESNPQFH